MHTDSLKASNPPPPSLRLFVRLIGSCVPVCTRWKRSPCFITFCACTRTAYGCGRGSTATNDSSENGVLSKSSTTPFFKRADFPLPPTSRVSFRCTVRELVSRQPRCELDTPSFSFDVSLRRSFAGANMANRSFLMDSRASRVMSRSWCVHTVPADRKSRAGRWLRCLVHGTRSV